MLMISFNLLCNDFSLNDFFITLLSQLKFLQNNYKLQFAVTFLTYKFVHVIFFWEKTKLIFKSTDLRKNVTYSILNIALPSLFILQHIIILYSFLYLKHNTIPFFVDQRTSIFHILYIIIIISHHYFLYLLSQHTIIFYEKEKQSLGRLALTPLPNYVCLFLYGCARTHPCQFIMWTLNPIPHACRESATNLTNLKTYQAVRKTSHSIFSVCIVRT